MSSYHHGGMTQQQLDMAFLAEKYAQKAAMYADRAAGCARMLQDPSAQGPSAEELRQAAESDDERHLDFTGDRSMSQLDPTTISERKVSSRVIDEQWMEQPQRKPTICEVEVVQEKVKHVPKKEIREIEKRVPKYEIEWVERIVEVPRIEYVDKTVEGPKYEEVIREVKVPQYVDRPVEVVREVKKEVVNYVEVVKEVPGEVIEVLKPYSVEQEVQITRYLDETRPVVVAQTVKPYIVEDEGEVCEVECVQYEPNCIPVEVQVLRPVQASMSCEPGERTHKTVTSVPAAQYNQILRQLNSHLPPEELDRLPYMHDENGHTPLLPNASYSHLPENTPVEGLDPNSLRQPRVTIDPSTRRALPLPDHIQHQLDQAAGVGAAAPQLGDRGVATATAGGGVATATAAGGAPAPAAYATLPAGKPLYSSGGAPSLQGGAPASVQGSTTVGAPSNYHYNPSVMTTASYPPSTAAPSVSYQQQPTQQQPRVGVIGQATLVPPKHYGIGAPQ